MSNDKFDGKWEEFQRLEKIDEVGGSCLFANNFDGWILISHKSKEVYAIHKSCSNNVDAKNCCEINFIQKN